MADRRNTPWDAMAERVAELLKHQLNKQNDQSQHQQKLSSALEQLLVQQQQTNRHLEKLTSISETQTEEILNWHNSTRRSPSRTFLRKMALEVPPVVLAVLLAFGINSWWQQRKADLAAEKAYRNIISELKINLRTCEQIVQQEKRDLEDLDQEIQDVSQGNIDADHNYGEGFSNFPLRDAAWQAANISNALSSFEDTLIIDLAIAYGYVASQQEWIRFTSSLDYSLKFNEETLLTFLKTNRGLLHGHMFNTSYIAQELRKFLRKYGEIEAEKEEQPTN